MDSKYKKLLFFFPFTNVYKIKQMQCIKLTLNSNIPLNKPIYFLVGMDLVYWFTLVEHIN